MELFSFSYSFVEYISRLCILPFVYQIFSKHFLPVWASCFQSVNSIFNDKGDFYVVKYIYLSMSFFQSYLERTSSSPEKHMKQQQKNIVLFFETFSTLIHLQLIFCICNDVGFFSHFFSRGNSFILKILFKLSFPLISNPPFTPTYIILCFWTLYCLPLICVSS